MFSKLKRKRRLTIGVASLLGLAVLALILGLRFPQGMLQVADGVPAGGADCIVILGGENWTRVPRAIELYQSNAAPLLLITGNGDAVDSQKRLLEQGIPEPAILLETNSTSTAENARFSVPLLREQGLTNIILVTSWYHSRRARNCFEHFGPDLTFISCPTIPDSSISASQDFSLSAFSQSWPDSYLRKRILQEYGKLLWYWPRHGICPL